MKLLICNCIFIYALLLYYFYLYDKIEYNIYYNDIYPCYKHLYKRKSKKATLIWGFAMGYKWERIKLFVVSLRKSGYNSDLVLGVSYSTYNKTFKKFHEYNITPLIIESVYPFFSDKNKLFYFNSTILKKCLLENREYNYKWSVYRFSVFYCYLLIYGKKYSYMFFLDVRDVIFQGNPFDWNFKEGLYLVEETKDSNILIKDEKYNSGWIKKYKNYSKVIQNKILNSGTIFGSIYYFLLFLEQFNEFLKFNKINTNEQGSLNYAYYGGYFKKIKFYKNRNQYGAILTTGIDLMSIKLLKIKNKKILNKDNTIPLIIHQYDRYKELLDMYKLLYID